MGRKQLCTREDMLRAAWELFMEKGYENTSMRDIAGKLDCSVGLTYTHFRNKDELFESALGYFLLPFDRQCAAAAANAERNPFQALYGFFSELKEDIGQFQTRYAAQMHPIVYRALREQTLKRMQPHIRKILKTLSFWEIRMPLSIPATAGMLAHGIGGTLLSDACEGSPPDASELLRAVDLLIGTDTLPAFASETDRNACIAWIDRQLSGLSPFEKAGIWAGFPARLASKEVLFIKAGKQIKGIAVFSRTANRVELLSVQQGFQRQGLGTRLLITALSQLPVCETVSVPVLSEDEASQQFFDRNGFRVQGTERVRGLPCRIYTRAVPATARELSYSISSAGKEASQYEPHP